jgi:hypothetical protein
MLRCPLVLGSLLALLNDSFRGYKRSTSPIPRKSPLRRASADSVRSSNTFIVPAN